MRCDIAWYKLLNLGDTRSECPSLTCLYSRIGTERTTPAGHVPISKLVFGKSLGINAATNGGWTISLPASVPHLTSTRESGVFCLISGRAGKQKKAWNLLTRPKCTPGPTTQKSGGLFVIRRSDAFQGHVSVHHASRQPNVAGERSRRGFVCVTNRSATACLSRSPFPRPHLQA